MNRTTRPPRHNLRAALLTLLFITVIASAGAQDTSIQDARELHEKALALFTQRDYQNGFVIAERAARAREALLGPEHPDTLASLGSLAAFHRARRDFERAEALHQRVLDTCERVFGADHAETASALQALALFYSARAAHARAEPLLVRALAIRERKLGQHPDTADTLQSLGNLYRATGALAKAESFYQRALDIRTQTLGDQHPETANSLDGLAAVYMLSGPLSKAEPLYLRVIAIRESELGAEHPDTADAIANLANFYRRSGAYSKSEPLQLRALAIRRKALGEDHPDVASSLNNLAKLYLFTGQYEQAEALLKRALAIQEKVDPESPALSAVLSNLADVYRITGAFAKAEPKYLRSIALQEKIFGAEHLELVSPINGLAALYATQRAFNKAEPLFKRSIDLLRNHGSDRANLAVQLMNLGGMYSSAMNYVNAEQPLQQALALFEELRGPQHPRTAEALSFLADLYRLSGTYAKAEPLQRRALAIQEKVFGPQHPLIAVTRRGLGLTCWATGHTTEALSLLRSAQAIDTANAEGFLVVGSESRNRSYLEERTRVVFQNATFSVRVPGPDSAAFGLASVLQYKGRVIDAASDDADRLRKSVSAEDRALFEQLAEVAAEFSRLTFQGAGNLSVAEYRGNLQRMANRQEALEAQLGARSAGFRRAMTSPTILNVARALPAGAALIEWFRYNLFEPTSRTVETVIEPRYVAYVLKQHGSPVAIDLGPAADIDKLVGELRAAASDPQRRDVREHAAALYNKILHPLRAQLQGVRHLMVSPDAALNLVPLAALLDQQGRYLLERFEITELTSGRDLLRLTDAEPRLSSNSVVIADPIFGELSASRAEPPSRQRSEEFDRAGLRFRSLPGTGLEAEAIATLLRSENARIYTRNEATETRLKQLHGPRILHLATHGFFLNDVQIRKFASGPIPADFAAENPLLRSGLALAGANERRSGLADDGILTALEASRLDLRGTELVVLSACETGVGEVRNGDGITGLRRSLLLAGARSQVASLWKVADLPTKELMVSFYQGLVKGQGRSAALRRAQLELLASPLLSHPYYWAGFAAIGDWGPLSMN